MTYKLVFWVSYKDEAIEIQKKIFFIYYFIELDWSSEMMHFGQFSIDSSWQVRRIDFEEGSRNWEHQ